MRKEKNELVRVQSLIENDRLSLSDNFEELLIIDLNNLLKEYFDYRGMPNLKIGKIANNLNVEISLQAQSIKSFGILSKQ